MSCELIDLVVCKICGNEIGAINSTHLSKHEMTTKDYREMFPDSPMKPKSFKEAQRQRRLKNWKNPKYREIMLTILQSPDSQKKSKKAIRTPEYRERKGRIMRRVFEEHPEVAEKISRSLKTFAETPEGKYHFGEIARLNVELGRNRGKRSGGYTTWQNMTEKERLEKMKKMWEAIGQRPTRPELEMINIIELFSLPLKYVGDFSFYIGTKNPDFIDTLGLNKVVEVFGDYWHSEGRQEGEKERIKQLAKYGWECLVIWEHELKQLSNEEIVEEIRGYLEV